MLQGADDVQYDQSLGPPNPTVRYKVLELEDRMTNKYELESNKFRNIIYKRGVIY